MVDVSLYLFLLVRRDIDHVGPGDRLTAHGFELLVSDLLLGLPTRLAAHPIPANLTLSAQELD
jgi:hypothetical protein